MPKLNRRPDFKYLQARSFKEGEEKSYKNASKRIQETQTPVIQQTGSRHMKGLKTGNAVQHTL